VHLRLRAVDASGYGQVALAARGRLYDQAARCRQQESAIEPLKRARAPSIADRARRKGFARDSAAGHIHSRQPHAAGPAHRQPGVLRVRSPERDHLSAQRIAIDFYLAFNMFRFAGIIHGIKGRAKRGTAASNNAKDLIDALPIFAKSAWDLASARV